MTSDPTRLTRSPSALPEAIGGKGDNRRLGLGAVIKLLLPLILISALLWNHMYQRSKQLTLAITIILFFILHKEISILQTVSSAINAA